MKLFPTQLRRPSLPVATVQPVRQVDIKATWNGNSNSPLDVETLYQFNVPAYTHINLFEYNHPAVRDFSIQYIDGQVLKSGNIDIDSALGSSLCESIDIPPSPSPSSIADLPWTRIDMSDSTYSSHVSSIDYDDDPFIMSSPGACKMLGIRYPAPSDSGLSSPSPENTMAVPLPPSPSPSSIASLPWSSPPLSPISDESSESFSNCSSAISSLLDVSDSHITVSNDSPSLQHIRLLLRASILLTPAVSGRGFVFSISGLAEFATSGVFTLIFPDSAKMSEWLFLGEDFTPTAFTSTINSGVFNAENGHSLRLLRPSDLHAPSAACPFLRRWSLLVAFAASLFTACAAALSVLPRRPWPYLKAMAFVWLCSRAFWHDGTIAIESDAWEGAVGLFSSPPPPPPPPPEILVPVTGAEAVNGPVTVQDWIDYWLGWKGPDGTWL